MSRTRKTISMAVALIAGFAFLSPRAADAQVSFGVSVGHDHHHHGHSHHDYRAYRQLQADLNRAQVYRYHYGSGFPLYGPTVSRSYYAVPRSSFYSSYGAYRSVYPSYPVGRCYTRYRY